MDIKNLINQLTGELKENAFEISDQLAEEGGGQVIDAMILLLEDANLESRIMAARTLSLTENKAVALEALLAAISNKTNETIAGDLMMFLDTFDLSNHYVEIFKHYLFGSFKVSMQAKDLMDHKEFDITPRVIRKVKKHWNHYTNNVKQDELFDLMKIEVEEVLNELILHVGE